MNATSLFWKVLSQRRTDDNGRVIIRPSIIDNAVQRFFESRWPHRTLLLGDDKTSRDVAAKAGSGNMDWFSFTKNRYENKKNYIAYLASLLPEAAKSESFLELGCADFSNLVRFSEQGFKNISGLEINKQFMQSGRDFYGERTAAMTIHEQSIENFVAETRQAYDTLFTTAVLGHIHPISNWVFEKFSNICRKRLLICEAEHQCNTFHYPRNYQRVFERFGFVQTHEELIEKDSSNGLPSDLIGFTIRTFDKKVTK